MPTCFAWHCLYIPYSNTQESLSKFIQNRYWDILGSTSFSSHSNCIFKFPADMSNMVSALLYLQFGPLPKKSKKIKINWTVLQWELIVYVYQKIQVAFNNYVYPPTCSTISLPGQKMPMSWPIQLGKPVRLLYSKLHLLITKNTYTSFTKGWKTDMLPFPACMCFLSYIGIMLSHVELPFSYAWAFVPHMYGLPPVPSPLRLGSDY